MLRSGVKGFVMSIDYKKSVLKSVLGGLLCVLALPMIVTAAPYRDISELGTSAGMIGLGNVQGFYTKCICCSRKSGGIGWCSQ
jgi:hypothetical protein